MISSMFQRETFWNRPFYRAFFQTPSVFAKKTWKNAKFRGSLFVTDYIFWCFWDITMLKYIPEHVHICKFMCWNITYHVTWPKTKLSSIPPFSSHGAPWLRWRTISPKTNILKSVQNVSVAVLCHIGPCIFDELTINSYVIIVQGRKLIYPFQKLAQKHEFSKIIFWKCRNTLRILLIVFYSQWHIYLMIQTQIK